VLKPATAPKLGKPAPSKLPGLPLVVLGKKSGATIDSTAPLIWAAVEATISPPGTNIGAVWLAKAMAGVSGNGTVGKATVVGVIAGVLAGAVLIGAVFIGTTGSAPSALGTVKLGIALGTVELGIALATAAVLFGVVLMALLLGFSRITRILGAGTGVLTVVFAVVLTGGLTAVGVLAGSIGMIGTANSIGTLSISS
jgi:hypothetical protein